ncbi:beta-ketoacyl-ACP synthase III [Streptomyces tubercidicus]|uniref:Beta-ketoacyl-[acyl-carrier-protein] synthase III n=1 Tax=Streptomyces tubercidicus TaxID=47759 RepID=A0A640UL29_9ACTN|nr:beta-ketoacyl-ACP synthase III [Streptomyces tubercidicus]WAU11269.1 ketoacyl-ACP synthase III [Streptomyces tubercidicus]GFE36507.1 3-oxoacyl-[acyl-carrier-protein] synthase 3 [Streptomyces tubercidicus]
MTTASAVAGRAAVVCGVGAALPPHIVANADLTARLDTTDEWIRSRTGINQRHVAGTDLSTTDLAVRAAVQALADGEPGPVEAVVVATTTPDRCCPATAPAVATRLGLTGIPAFDLAAGCTGFLYGLATAAGFLAAGTARTVLVVGADRLATLPDPEDRTTVPLFGDGAGAVVLRRGSADEAGALGPVVLGSDGTGADLIRAARPGALHVDGADVFRHAVDRMASTSRQAATASGWELVDVDRLVPHQANSRITAFVARRLGFSDDRQLSNIAETGNTGAASIPLLLARSAADGRLKPGHRTLLTAFGAGLTWGATTLTWPDLSLTRLPEGAGHDR